MKQSFSKIMKAELEAREAAEKAEKAREETEAQVHEEKDETNKNKIVDVKSES